MGGLAGLVINDLPKYFILGVYFAINAYLFYDGYTYYEENVKFFYTRKLLGSALAWARAPAVLLNLNCMLVLMPVCRNILSYFRQACTCCPRRIRRILDKNIKFHRICAYMIVLNTLIHYFAHCFNLEFFSGAHSVVGDAENVKLIRKLAELKDSKTKDTTYLDPIYSDGTFQDWTVGLIFTLTGGWTGVIITACLFMMVTSSIEFIRRSYFEVFWFTHHLFIVFYAFLLFHGISMQVRGQTARSLREHDPLVCYKKPEQWGLIAECPIPEFAGSPPGTWKWVIVPLVLYVAERILRVIRLHQNVEILKVVKHPSRVIEIQMRKKKFHAEVGQYIFIKCEQISMLEWHPFTLTSAPEENYFSVHIRIVGDWTTALSKLVADENKPVLAVDGPFGTASEDVFSYDVAICVGSGIGVTPFASLLKSVWYKNNNNELTPKLTKVYFFWICPEINAFEWFGDMLSHLESQLAEIGRKDLIEYHIYLTRGWSTKQAKAIFVHENEAQDVITGLEQKTFYGRPNWDEVFKEKASKHADQDIGVFFCGVAALSHILHKMCNKHSSISGARFHYNKENF